MTGQNQHSFDPFNPLISSDGKVYPKFPGNTFLHLNKMYAPSAESICAMLKKVRGQEGWSQTFTASVLGVPLITLRRWEKGTRKPCGAARKLIWFLHQTLVAPDKPDLNVCTFATWGQMEGVPIEVVEKWAEMLGDHNEGSEPGFSNGRDLVTQGPGAAHGTA